MAQFTSIDIDVSGKKIKQFSSFELSQSIFNHHRFQLICPAEAIEGTDGSTLSAAKDLAGGTITIKLNTLQPAGSMQFIGVVTLVQAERHHAHAGNVIIEGFSPTILADNGVHCKSWEKANVKTIAQSVLKHFPQNALKPRIAPGNLGTLSYTVQYKESAWQFLCRLSALYGEWFYFDGEQLLLGPPRDNSITLEFGSSLHEFNMALEVKPVGFKMMAYDYMNGQVYTGEPEDIAGKAGLNDLGKHALQKSESFYTNAPKQWHNQFLTNKKQLDDYVNTRAAMRSSNMVRFSGVSDHPGVQLGIGLSVQGKNVYNNNPEPLGDYTVISVEHRCDGDGKYRNSFMAIPAMIKMPPVPGIAEPHCETQSAIVTDNHDPKGLGRIRVKFHWMNGSEKSPWLRVTTPHAGSGKGMFFIPEKDEEVIVGFEGDSAGKPYIIGTVYHGKAKTDFSNAGNDVKALQTRSGNKILLNDKDGSVTVCDKDGNQVMFDGKGNVAFSANESFTVCCGSSSFEMKKDGTINLSGKDITVNGTNTTTSISGEASFSTKSSGDAEMNGTNSTVNGTSEATLSALKTTLSGENIMVVKSSGPTSVEGAIVKLN